ncbi:MAG: type II secretion system minor pseudopilin GspK [Pseudomonadota bacterium]
MRTQSGVALITAVMVVAMASIAALAMTQTLQLSIHRTSNILMADQRYLYTLGSEAWARGQLIRDLASDNPYDGLDEDWAKELPLTTVEEGQVYAKTSDLQGLFNLNNLYLEEQSEQETSDSLKQQLAVFQRLLSLLELNEGIAQATADWLDPDIQPLYPDGAEDNEYLGQTPAYRTANTRMADPTELRLINGVTSETYEKISPYITTLPESTGVNVNTASAILLRALIQPLDESNVEMLINERKENPFKDTKAFMDRLNELLSDNEKASITNLEPMISVSSNYFQLETAVQMDNATQRLVSLLYKSSQGVSTLSRRLGSY